MKPKSKKILLSVVISLTVAVGIAFSIVFSQAVNEIKSKKITENPDPLLPDWVIQDIIPVDGSSRRGLIIDEVTNIVVHYVANPMSSAKNNRDYYANPESEVSSHFVVGLDGEIILCIPLDERSSATGERNSDTVSIEVCHPDESGRFTEASYNSLVKLCRYLIDRFSLSESDIIRHYDVTGKLCPKYYVENEDSWQTFLRNVKELRKKN